MQTHETINQLPEEESKEALRNRLIAGYLANAELDALLAEDWRPIEEEVWMNLAFWIP